MYPPIPPRMGDKNSATRIFVNPAGSMASRPNPAQTEPIMPPMSAWDVLDGMPKNKVVAFHAIAANSDAYTTGSVTASLATTSSPIVVATATPKINGPTALADGGHPQGAARTQRAG